MEFVERPHGWTLTDALSELQVELFRFTFASSAKSGFQRDHGRKVAWAGISSQLERGELHATGFAPGGIAPVAIHPAFASAAVPDFEANTLGLNGTFFAAVRLWRGAGATPKQDRRVKSPLEAADMKLFLEWERLVGDGLSAWAAAAKLAPKAGGGGSEESKTKRLHERFTQVQSSSQN